MIPECSGTERWIHHWGHEDYFFQGKRINVQPLLLTLDAQELIGPIVVDIGSGSEPVSDLLILPHTIITVDIGGTTQPTKKGYHLTGDINDLADLNSRETRKKIISVVDFLKLPRSSIHLVDTFICSDILNYVDFRTILTTAHQLLKPHGLIIIYNKPNLGITDYLSTLGVKSNIELISFLKSLDHTILDEEHFTYHPNTLPSPDKDILRLVTQKK